MKPYIYATLLFFLLLSSCRGPEKLVEKGEYDIVLKRANTIFKRNKAPSFHWVLAAEQSLLLANIRDLDAIEYYEKQGGLSNWKNVYYTAKKIADRQEELSETFPYLSNIEYESNFDFTNIQPKIEEARSRLAVMYFEFAQKEMEYVRQGSKKAALASIRLIDSAFHWRRDIHRANELRQEAVDSAQINLAIYINDNDTGHFENHLSKALSQLFVPYLNMKIYPNNDFDTDYHLHLGAFQTHIGGEYESVDETIFSKEIVTGYNVTEEWDKTDSVWVTITEEITEIVYGSLIEYEQSKDGSLRANFSIENVISGQEVENENLNVSYFFSNNYSETSGDRRALTGVCSSGSWRPFPSNYDMVNNMNANLANRLKRYIKKYDWWYE